MTVRLLAEAADDVVELVDWYEILRVGLGVRFQASVNRVILAISNHPKMFGRSRGSPTGRDIRIATTRRFRGKIVYELTAIEVVILSVHHARSNRSVWHSRLNNP